MSGSAGSLSAPVPCKVCGKTGVYMSQGDAAVAASTMLRYHDDIGALRVYECVPGKGVWHFTRRYRTTGGTL